MANLASLWQNARVDTKKKWKKPEPATIERFQAALPADPGIQRKQMFGYPATFVKGNFFTGLFEDDVVLRLPEPIKDRLPALARADGFNPMGTGKGMKDWYVVPRGISAKLPPLAELLAAAFEEVRRLPAKVPKKKSAPGTAKKKKAAGA